MKRLLPFVAALSLVSGAALAQEHEHGGGHPGGGQRPAGAPQGGHQGPPQGAGPGAGPGGWQGGARGGWQGGGNGAVQGPAQGQFHNQGYGAPVQAYGGGARSGPQAFYGARGSRDARWNYQGGWRQSFHARPFFYPNGWGYRRWGIGQYLPPIFFASEYFIGDFYDYGLPPPPYGCRWVRYGPDALLIDLRTGAVVQALYGVFWW